MSGLRSAGRSAGAVLTIDLGAIVANWRLLAERAAPAACGAVVKADAYGLGAAEVVPALAGAGCRTFFVATLDEGLAVRQALAGTSGDGAPIYVFAGMPPGSEDAFVRHHLIPVLNALADLDAWAACARTHGRRLPAALHVDTGMSRLGLPAAELRALAEHPERLAGVDLRLVMSHLACADAPDHPLNPKQCHAFRKALAMLPAAPAALANSSGIFLGRDYTYDLVRPGAALYGIAPVPGEVNPMRPVVRLDGRILQVREIDSGVPVGYGATYGAHRRERIATVGVGYADGYLRSLSNRSSGYIGAHRVPLVGRVSMDLITFDVTDVPDVLTRPGASIELIGPQRTVDAVAQDAQTIGYEILTSLGSRYARAYLPVAD
jgi:alanine racemase